MKIGFVFDDSLDFPDGVQQYILMLGRELSARGHEVHYLVGETARTDIPNVHSLARNIKVKFNGNIMRIPLPANRRRLRRLLAAENFDVLHVQAPFSPFLAGRIIAAAQPHTPIVSTFLIAPASKVAELGNRAVGLLTRRALARINRHIALSPVAQELARDAYGVPSQIIPSPVEFQQAVPAAKDAQRILFLGRLVDRKGCNLLLDAVARAEQLPDFPDNVEVVIAGDGPLRAAAEQQAAALRTPVRFLGFIDEAEKGPLLASADVAVFPSTGGESFGIVLIEACAAGAGVVLAGDNVGYRSTFADYEDALVDPANTEEFAQRLCRALTDEDFAQRVHQWQQDHVQRFAAPKVVDQILSVYEGAC